MSAKIQKDGLRPSPVYEAHMSDCEVVRLSFYSPAGKPIDTDAGRRAADVICARPEFGTPKEIAASFFVNYAPRPILRAFVEHPSIGRVEHVPGQLMAAPARAKRRPAAPLGERARAFAIMLIDEFSRDHIDAQAVAQAVIGLREALR